MKRFWKLLKFALILLFLILVGGIIFGDKKDTLPSPTPSPTPSPLGEFKKGVGFWPTRVDTESINDWFEASRLADATVFYAQKGEPFLEPENDDPLSYNTVLNLGLERAKREGYETYLGLEPLTGARNALDVPLNWKGSAVPRITDTAWQEAYSSIVKKNAFRHKPTYFNICVEMNMWYDTVPREDWIAFRSFYDRLYEEIKAISPSTKVFCSLQYEVMSGQSYGKSSSQWELLDDPSLALPHQDRLGISSYPYGNVHADWYKGLRSRTIPDVFVAELGYIGTRADYPMSADEEGKQRAFIESLPALWNGLPLDAIMWLNLTDLDPEILPGLPDSLYIQGLLSKDFVPKRGLETWREL